VGPRRLLQPLADRQSRAGKSEVEIPAREMLAEMLLSAAKRKKRLRNTNNPSGVIRIDSMRFLVYEKPRKAPRLELLAKSLPRRHR